jgi:hypothetical protein
MSRVSNINTGRAHHYHCDEYPIYTFSTVDHNTFYVGVLRGLDPLVMIDLLVGEILKLTPLLRRKIETENLKLYKIMSIDMSLNCRKAYVVVQRIY